MVNRQLGREINRRNVPTLTGSWGWLPDSSNEEAGRGLKLGSGMLKIDGISDYWGCGGGVFGYGFRNGFGWFPIMRGGLEV